jgi:uncharacterized protein
MLHKIQSIFIFLSIVFTVAAADDFKQACRDGNATACYKYALPLVTGKNAKVQDIREEGLSYMRRACLEGEKRGCDVMGENYYKDKNYAIAMTYLDPACNRGVRSACEKMGMIYRDGHDVRPDDVKTREYFEKACALDSGDACFNIAIMYRGGFGVEKNRVKEKAYYKKGCDAGLKVACKRFTELDNEDKGIETGIWATIKSWFQ